MTSLRNATDPLRRLLTLARPLRRQLAVAVLGGAGTTASGVALLSVSGYLIARASQHPAMSALAVGVVAVRGFGLARGMLRYTERLASHDVAFRVLADLRIQVYRRLERVVPGAVGGLRSGDLLARLVSDVDAVQDLFVRSVVPPLAALLVGGASVAAVLWLLAPAAAVLAVGLLVAGAAVPALSVALNRRAGQALAQARGDLATRVDDALGGVAELVVSGGDVRVLDRFDEMDAQLERLARRRALLGALGQGAVQAVSGATVWLLLLVAVGARTSGPVTVAVVVLTGLAAFEATAPLAAAAQKVVDVRAGATRLFEVLDLPDPVHQPPEPAALPSGPGRLCLRNVRVRYVEGAADALFVDLDVEPGTRLAVVGASGAGKSTLVQVLLRLRDPDSGEVTIDGTPYRSLDDDDVRTRVGGCPADPYVFDSTLRENLRLARPAADDQALGHAAQAAGLLDWVTSLEHGWDTRVGVHGNGLSGGERQRLALARALLADPDVLVLDEPTAHLDPTTRQRLMSDLLSATAGRTTVLVTHDLVGIEAMDQVVVLSAGHVVERGTPVELLARPSGWLRGMVDRQGVAAA